MTEPIDQATKERIEDEAKYYADEFTDDGAYKFLNAQKFDAYIAGATVWAERLKQKENDKQDLVQKLIAVIEEYCTMDMVKIKHDYPYYEDEYKYIRSLIQQAKDKSHE